MTTNRINELSEEDQIRYVKKNYQNIRYISNPSEEVQLASIRKHAWAYSYIKNPTNKVSFEILKINGYYIKYIKFSSEEFQLEAVKHFNYNHINSYNDDIVKDYIKSPKAKELYNKLKAAHSIIK
jgi:hypothetical protein